ncbi:hypothetical protein PV328_001885 [Microctonus aethiopoides]|uniref:AAA-ATPase-like domain-containing protein n=1 Tax=Microctonus aethiopoides TaxID=144406 RepID=A0AA39KY23_9HYME|nr:hypothetical protein PV328_001885 [Microctonus aethiopoides]
MGLRSGIRVKRKMCETEADETTHTADITKSIVPSTKRRKMAKLIKNESEQTSSNIMDIKMVDRTFGKSLNMDMIRRFVQIELDNEGKRIVLNVDKDKHCLKEEQPASENFKLFRGKKIFEDKEFMYQHFGKYPTINVDFKTVQGKNFNQVLTALKRAVHTAFEEHAYLEKSDIWSRAGCNKKTFMKYFDEEKFKSLDEDETIYGLHILSKFLYEYYDKKKVFVFIDEFDVPVNSMVYDSEMSCTDRSETIRVLKLLIQSLLKDSDDFVERSLSTACQQLGGILLDSANNVKRCAFMQEHPFSEFYGFTENEVGHLLKVANKSSHFKFVKSQFNGFVAKSQNRKNINMYSPYSIIKYISCDVYVDEWSEGIRSEIFRVMGHPLIKPKIIDLMNRKTIQIKYHGKLNPEHIDQLSRMLKENDVDYAGISLFMQFLYEMAFFTPISLEDGNLTLKVPNAIVCDRLKDVLYDIHLDQKYPTSLEKRFTKALNAVAKSCDDISVRNLAQTIADLFKYADPPPQEAEIQALLFAYIRNALKKSKIECKTDINTRCDIVLVNGRHQCGIIIELKPYRDAYMNSEKGHQQILNNKYYTLLDESSIERFLCCPRNTGLSLCCPRNTGAR